MYMNFKFTVDQKELSTNLGFALNISSKRTNLESTNSVMIEVATAKELLIKSTDLDSFLICSIATHTDAPAGSCVLVNCKRLHDLVKDLSGILEFSVTPSSLEITSKDQKEMNIKLSVSNVDEFPNSPENVENFMCLKSDIIADILRRMLPITPQNNANPALNGIYIKTSEQDISFVATDGHSLAKCNVEMEIAKTNFSCTLPKRAAVELKKIIDIAKDSQDIFIGTCKGILAFSNRHFNFFTRLVADPYPNYEHVLNCNGFFKGEVNSSEFNSSLRRAGCLLSGKFMASNFDFNQNKITVSLDNKEVGALNETISCSLSLPAPVKTKFYSPFILAAAQAFDSESIPFYIKDHDSPIFFEEHDSNSNSSFTYLVMPIVL